GGTDPGSTGKPPQRNHPTTAGIAGGFRSAGTKIDPSQSLRDPLPSGIVGLIDFLCRPGCEVKLSNRYSRKSCTIRDNSSSRGHCETLCHQVLGLRQEIDLAKGRGSLPLIFSM